MDITIDQASFIITLIALYFAYFQWKKTSREKRLHLLKVLKIQLEGLGPWMGTTGSGYGEELNEDQKFDNANPFKLIYETGTEPLININMLDEMNNVPDEIIGELNQLYYDLVRIKNIQNFRSLYITSDIKMSNSLAISIKDYVCKTKCKSMNEFCNTIKDMDEKIMLDRLLHYGKVLHCDVIGNKDRCARQHWEKLYKWVNDQLISKNDTVFIFATYLIIFGFFFGLGVIQVNNIFFWSTIILTGTIFNFINGAFDGVITKINYKKMI